MSDWHIPADGRSAPWHPPKWPIGTRVRLSETGRAMHWGRPDIEGVVTGGARMPNRLNIRRDTQKTAMRYHEDFWEPVE